MVAWEFARKKLMQMGYAEPLVWAAYRLVRPLAPRALSHASRRSARSLLRENSLAAGRRRSRRRS